MRIILVFFIAFFVFSCNDERKEFFDNGNLKKVYTKNNKKNYEGYFTEFFENGNIKEKHLYNDGVKIDSSRYYDLESELLEIKVWLDDSMHKSIIKDAKNNILSEGMLSNSDSLNRIGTWSFFNINGKNLDSLVEYKNINKKAYVNQIWLIKNEDTLLTKGNFYRLLTKDTTRLDEIVRLRFVLRKPFFNRKSNMSVIVPYRDEDLNKDFSNISEIERDTFPSLMNDGIPHPEVADLNLRYITEFGLEYSTSGLKRIRGMIVEKTMEGDESLERRLFFETHVYIKD